MKHKVLQQYALKMGEYMTLNNQVLEHLSTYSRASDFEKYLADATVYMEFLSTLVIGWQWLKIAAKSSSYLDEKTSEYPKELSTGMVNGLRFYFKYELSKMLGLAETLQDPDFSHLTS